MFQEYTQKCYVSIVSKNTDFIKNYRNVKMLAGIISQ